MTANVLAPFSLIITSFVIWLAVEFIGAISRWPGWGEPSSRTIAEAGITSKLIPLLGPYIRPASASKLYIVGSDGSYARHKRRGKKWLSQLEVWLRDGCEITYILTEADPECVSILLQIAAKYDRQFKLVDLVQRRQLPTELTSLAKKYATFHPVLLEVRSSGRRVMWIENYHPKSSMLAFNIEFVAPDDARADPRFDEFMNDFITMERFTITTDDLPPETEQIAVA